jgi:hypothetical protein
MDSKSKSRNGKFSSENPPNQESIKIENLTQSKIVEEICDENLVTLKKIHAIKKYHEIKHSIREPFQVKNVIIPFSSIFGDQERYIYSGEEMIPFKKRHPLYQAILLNEFKE